MKGYRYGKDIIANKVKYKTMMLDYGGSKTYLAFSSAVGNLVKNSLNVPTVVNKSDLRVIDVMSTSYKPASDGEVVGVRTKRVGRDFSIQFFNDLNSKGVSL